MQNSSKTRSRTAVVFAIVAILASISYTAYRHLGGVQGGDAVPESYLRVRAIVTAVFPPRVTRYGAKQAQYDILFLDQEGNKQVKFRQDLKAGLQVSDSITVYYNPYDPAANVLLDTK